LRGNFEAREREEKEKEGTGKGKEGRYGSDGSRTPLAEINFWLWP